MFFLYNVCIDWIDTIWYAVEQYGEKIDRNVGTRIDYEPTAVMR